MVFYGPEEALEAKELGQKSHEASTRVEGVPYPPPSRRALQPCGPLVESPDLFSTPTPLIYPQTSRIEARSGVPPPQASIATKNLSGPCSGTLPEEEIITDGHLPHPGALRDEEGVVNPRG